MKKIVKLKLNFKLGEETPNGRIYKPRMLIKEFDGLLENKSLFVTKSSFNGTLPLDNIFGVVYDYELIKDGSVVFDVKVINDNLTQLKDYMEVSTIGLGIVNESNNKEINDFKLTALFLVSKV